MVQIARWQDILVAVLLLLGLTCASPKIIEAGGIEEVPGLLPSQKVDLSLDLRGGSYLLMEDDFERAMAERLGNISDGIAAPLRRAQIRHSSGVQGSKILIELRDPNEMGRARELIRNEVQTYVVSEDGPRIEIEVPEERMREIQTSIKKQFLWPERAQTPSETKP